MTVLGPRQVGERYLSCYEQVGTQLARLIQLLGVDSEAPLIARSYALLCRESLAFRVGHRPVRASRVNADGTPFQFSLTLGASMPALQFLTETGEPDQSNSQRLAADHDRICTLSRMFGTERALSRLEPLVEQMAPHQNRALLADDSGTTWVGVAFASNHSPKLKIYINAKWGDETSRWARLGTFASELGVTPAWLEIRQLVGVGLEPLGVALVLGGNAEIAGRIYLSGYGKPFAYLEELGRTRSGSLFEDHLRRYGQIMLGEDYAYPTRSVVCSLGIESGQLGGLKVEFCGHCAFDSDVQAKARSIQWLRDLAVDTGPYEQVVELLSGGALSVSEAKLHAYVGIGSARDVPDTTFYFNPAASLC